VAVSITETVLLSSFVTYTFVPSGLTATPIGPPSTFTVAVTVFVSVSITETVLSALFVIYAYAAVGESLCTLNADAVDEIEIRNKIKHTKDKDIERNLFSIYLSPDNVFLSERMCRFEVQIFSDFIRTNLGNYSAWTKQNQYPPLFRFNGQNSVNYFFFIGWLSITFLFFQ
jgi:hypothetical protein